MSIEKLKNQETDLLFEAFLKIKDVETWYKVFGDLCTIKEIQDLTHRFQVAKLLNEGQSYQNIIEITNASSTTISRVAKALTYGEDGYQFLLKKSKEDKIIK